MSDLAMFLGLFLAYFVAGLFSYVSARTTRRRVTVQDSKIERLEKEREQDRRSFQHALDEKDAIINHLRQENAKLNHVNALYDTLKESHELLQASHKQLEARVEDLSRQVTELTAAIREKDKMLSEKDQLYAEATAELKAERDNRRLLEREVQTLEKALQLVGVERSSSTIKDKQSNDVKETNDGTST